MVELPPFLNRLTNRKTRRSWMKDAQTPQSLVLMMIEFDVLEDAPGWQESPRGRWVIFQLMRAGLLKPIYGGDE